MPEIRSCIFCDIVRSEIGGKVSALGIFGEQIRISGPAPHVLPSFGVLVFVADPEQLRAFDVHITITLPGEAQPALDQVYRAEGIPGRRGYTFALQVLQLEFKNEGPLLANIELGTEPPVRRTFELDVVFAEPLQPPAVA